MELFKIMGTIALSGMNQFNADMDSAAGKGSTLASKLSSGLQTVAKVGGAAIAAATTAVATLTKSAIENFAEYEQLTGGVETLFKDSADTVMNYAANAYQTAGLSANDYMETVTSFSAALLQGLGGNTAAAADMANLAITDMSDNANKMGSDMASIQNAYQGFAKQNYTMLDNLKLGYSGTASEMARLINDSGVLGTTMKVTADTVNNVSFDKIIEAIHVIQTNMGITGTTALEASTTISGSIAMMKASWTNLTVGIADDTQNMTMLINNFVTSVGTVAENLLPRITIALNGISQLVTQLAPIIASAIPMLIATVLPPMIDAGVQLVNALLQGITQNAGTITSGAISAASQFVTGLVSIVPNVITAGTTLIMSLVTGIATALPEIIASVSAILPEIVSAIESGTPLLLGAAIILFNAMAEAVPQVVSTLTSAVPQLVTSIASALSSATPNWMNAVVAFWSALAEAIPQVVTTLTATLPTVISAIVSAITSGFPILLEGAVTLFTALIDAIPQIITNLTAVLPQIITAIVTVLVSGTAQLVSAAITLLMAIVDAIPDIISALNSALPDIINTIVSVVIAGLPTLLQAAIQLFMALVDAIPQIVISLSQALPEIVTTIVTTLIDNYPLILQTGTELFLALVEAIPAVVVELVSALGDLAQNGVDTLLTWCDSFGQIATDWINSLLDGLKGAWDSVTSWFSEAWNSLTGGGEVNVSVSGGGGSTSGGGAGRVNGSHAFGLDYVPFDGYVAELHKGEMVVPANESNLLRNGIYNISGQNDTVVTLLTQILDAVTVMDGNMGDNMKKALDGTSLTVNRREFGRMVKAVN